VTAVKRAFNQWRPSSEIINGSLVLTQKPALLTRLTFATESSKSCLTTALQNPAFHSGIFWQHVTALTELKRPVCKIGKVLNKVW
jgi:hypothetical protein